MKIIKPSFEIWEQEPGLEGIYKQIEKAGRICYKSEDKITEGSAEKFVDRMIASGHGAMLEHGTVYLDLPDSAGDYTFAYFFDSNAYSKTTEIYIDDVTHNYVTTNFRVIVENFYGEDLSEILQYLCEPTEFHEKRTTVHFTTQIAITREFNRHRVNSIAEQSTRYCNYSKDKFNGVGINLPTWVESKMQKLYQITDDVLPTFEQLKQEYFSVSDQGLTKDDWGDIEWWLWSNFTAEESYLKLIEKGRKPQEARVVLPLDTNTELIHTASVSDWNHFFGLRDDKQHSHPDAYKLAHGLKEEFNRLGYL